jgi:hypothetical protein
MMNEIQEKTKLDDNQIEQIMVFLRQYNFVATDEAKKEVRLEENFRQFLSEEPIS